MTAETDLNLEIDTLRKALKEKDDIIAHQKLVINAQADEIREKDRELYEKSASLVLAQEEIRSLKDSPEESKERLA